MMNTEIKKDYLLITPNEKSFSDFYKAFQENYTELQNKHLLIDLLAWVDITAKQLLSFIETATKHQKGKHSFIILNTAVDIDHITETLNIVPTLQEAEDLLEMEIIERELGF